MTSYRWKTLFEEEDRPEKPRRYGVTEMRGPHHSLFSQNLLQDVFDSMGQFVDGLKFAGGSHSLIPKSYIKEMTNLAHKHNVYVSTGDWAEYLQRGGPSAFKDYIEDYGLSVLKGVGLRAFFSLLSSFVESDNIRLFSLKAFYCMSKVLCLICLKVNLFVDHSQVMDLECLRGCNLDKDHVSVLGTSYYRF
ncbi:hypothetical protein SASPL_144610 [Salvia splendens]|uniref:Phosphosulfolactate synthase n=1 Tax=Salvia splendens TaxID=180675 RepID=A0A8X8Z7K3_SALSN|nr:hypothetical protein SASPL_144610 [Salvia splendens]